MTNKTQEFLLILQTGILAHIASDAKDDNKLSPSFRAMTGISDAMDAAKYIPEQLSAVIAAGEYFEFWKATPTESPKFRKEWMTMG